jgi:hypothetical protein
MQRFRPRKKTAGITLVELMMYCLLAGAVGLIAYHTLRTSSTLSTKNASLNRSHDELRSALDRLASNLRMARNVPTLLNTSGAVVATGPAAGVRYDRILGEPYVLDPVMSAGSMPSTATTLSVHRSTSAIGAPPIPKTGDVLIIETQTGTVRARITGVNASAPGASSQKITLGFSAPVGKALSWGANQPQWARLVRQEAIIVMPNAGNGRNELRLYSTFEPMPSLSDKSKYTVLTDQVGTASGEGTPFNVTEVNGDKIVQVNLRIQARDFNRWLADKEANQLNTYFRMNLSFTSRLRPKTTN